ncbi:histidine kinase [Spongiactinospora sp. TRM90649]|uniref:sensor histidine kinase n=1 Tax=Spongiactinospora sp. TRM90649 TaxID=3031114 RepID=UPI0023F9F3B6|nr:histidine kinase [Spongiactinospora sp. TRM90649]MDF5753947.1 histidine kinase [Spongiactinospora sp. TRM90649]
MNDTTPPAPGVPAATRVRRSGRDWAVDFCLFLFAVLFGLVTGLMRLEEPSMGEPPWLFKIDQLTGVLGCAAVWLRRRHPVRLAVVLIVLSAFSETVAGAMLVAVFTVAVHRAPRVTWRLLALAFAAAVIYVVLRPEADIPAALVLLFGLAVQSAAAGWGLFVHHRRRLVLSLRERAEHAESEARLRAEQAQQEVRQAIAREIHDVLGHRLSLLSVHAGALEYRPDAPAEDITLAAKVIRESAHRALQDLREVIGVLRAPVGELPQFGLADLEPLAEESGHAGMRVKLRRELPGPAPERAGRTAYRVVQEALTNARKHAPGADVEIGVTGEPGRGLTVDVRNSAPAKAAPPGPSAGQGLAGLAERVALVDGRLEHGPTPEGGWRLTAWLPWPP